LAKSVIMFARVRLSMTKFSILERIIQDLRFHYQPKHHGPQTYQVEPVQSGSISTHR
jgi:hypothetical protein